MLVKISPVNQRAKNRVREHGSFMTLMKIQGTKFLVQSLHNTDKASNDKWLGWFEIDAEATYTVLEEGSIKKEDQGRKDTV